MTNYQISLIKTTWQTAAANKELVGELFYGCFFEIAPEVKPMFSRTAIPEQSKKLLAVLSYVISKLEALDEITDEVSKLAQRHVKYGVKEEHYVPVGVALLWTLEQVLGDAWNEETKQAWLTCYKTLSSAMISPSRYSAKDAA